MYLFECINFFVCIFSSFITGKSISMHYTLDFLGRDELLTERALAWNKRKVVGMTDTLSKRYVRVSKE